MTLVKEDTLRIPFTSKLKRGALQLIPTVLANVPPFVSKLLVYSATELMLELWILGINTKPSPS